MQTVKDAQLNETEHVHTDKGLHWGLVSKYRTEIMGFACLWVIAHHNFCNWPSGLAALKWVLSYGNAGVDMFLFLSGIGLYFAYRNKPAVGTFYKRRFVRLMLPYVFIAVPFWIWKAIILGEGSFVLQVTMLSSYLLGNHMTWYVGASVVFYLLYPALHKLMHDSKLTKRYGKSVVTVVVVAVMMIAIWLLRKILPAAYGAVEIGLTRSVVFIVGCAAGSIVFTKKKIGAELIWASVFFLLMYIGMFGTEAKIGGYWIRLSYMPVAIAVVLVLTALFNRFSLVTIKKILRYFGERSLEIYLTHVLLRYICERFGLVEAVDPWGAVSYAIVIAVSLVISEIVHWLCKMISRKCLKEKKLP